jgi:hypothetical protein
MADYDTAGRDLLDIDRRLFAKKDRVDSINEEISRYMYPERSGFTSTLEEGEEFASHLTDSTPSMVRREFGDQLGAMMRQGDWYQHKVGNKDVDRDPKARNYLEFMTSVTRSIIASRDSQFSRSAKDGEHDIAAFGMCAVQLCYTKDRSNVMFKTHHLKEIACAEGPEGLIDHVHRKCDMTAQAMAHWFGEGKLPEAAKQALKDKNVESTFPVRHIIVPTHLYEPHRKFPKGAKWADIYVTADGKILQEMPAFTFDYVIPRLRIWPHSVYGYSSLALGALPQARMVQRMMATMIEAGELQVAPPIIAVDDAITSPIDFRPSGITYIDAQYDERLGQVLRPLELGKNVQLGADLLRDARQGLMEAFQINKLALNTATAKTATEARMMMENYIRNALPLFDPIESEWTGPLLDTLTQKVMRAGGFGPTMMVGDGMLIPEDMPESLYGQDIEFEFKSSLRAARDAKMVEGYKEGLGLLGATAQIDPNAIQEVDLRTSFRDAFGAVSGGRADWLVDPEEAAKARQAAEEKQAQQAALQQAGEGGQVAEQVGKGAQAVGDAGLMQALQGMAA